MQATLVNHYLAHKQHLLPASQHTDLLQTIRDIVGLHATDPTAPYFSLWARTPSFERQTLEDMLYQEHSLTKVLCMRATLHVVPGDELACYLTAFRGLIGNQDPVLYRGAALLSEAGLCPPEQAKALQDKLHRQILDFVAERKTATVREINQALPELQKKIQHDIGQSYEGEFSVGSRFVPRMSVSGLLIRARPRGTWRSNLYEYACLADWLPDVDLHAVSFQDAQTWIVRRYLAAFGPVTFDDIQWWTGFNKSEIKEIIQTITHELTKVSIKALGKDYWMLTADAQRLREFTPPTEPYACLLPNLDPYIMGYKDRRRFLSAEQRAKLFDRAGNAVPTVWLDGRIIGAWGQRKSGEVVYHLFEPLAADEQTALTHKVHQLESFLNGEYLPPRFRTTFTQMLK